MFFKLSYDPFKISMLLRNSIIRALKSLNNLIYTSNKLLILLVSIFSCFMYGCFSLLSIFSDIRVLICINSFFKSSIL